MEISLRRQLEFVKGKELKRCSNIASLEVELAREKRELEVCQSLIKTICDLKNSLK